MQVRPFADLEVSFVPHRAIQDLAAELEPDNDRIPLQTEGGIRVVVSTRAERAHLSEMRPLRHTARVAWFVDSPLKTSTENGEKDLLKFTICIASSMALERQIQQKIWQCFAPTAIEWFIGSEILHQPSMNFDQKFATDLGS